MPQQSLTSLPPQTEWQRPQCRRLTVTALHLRTASRLLLGLALLVITYLALTPSPPPAAGLGWDKANHYVAFFVLGLLSYCSQSQNEWQGWLALAGYGVGIEVLQWAGGFRQFELWDMVANVTGLICCILCQPILLRLPQIQAIKSLRGTS